MRNKYVATLLLFVLWMSFLDNNDLFRHYGLLKRLKEVKRELRDKQAEVDDTKRQLQELRNKKTLEKFAREEYRFRRKNEEIFVIVSENEVTQ